MLKLLKIDRLLVETAKLPMVKIDRELFLRKELRDRYRPEVIELAIQYNPAYAGIPVEDINKIAKSCIKGEATQVSTISAAAGLPGGFAILGSLPADLAQYFAHILRILQKLIYLYGWSELGFDTKEMNDETKNLLILFIGIMFGVNSAVNTVHAIAAQVAKKVAKKLPQEAITKGFIYPVVKKIASILGVQMSKKIFANGVSKAVPVVGAVTSGALTYITFNAMAEKLRKHLAKDDLAIVEVYKHLSHHEIIDAEFVEEIE